MNRYHFLPPPIASIVFTLSFIAYLVAGNAVFASPDMAWHVAAGDLIRHTGIPATNVWSFSDNAAPWYNLSWLWDVWLSCILQWAGTYGLYVFGAAFVSIVLATLTYTLKARGMVSDLYILITILLVWYVLLSYLYPQPWLATLLLTIGFHHFLHRSRTENGYRALWPLPVLMALWANLHGGFIVGLSLIVIYMIEAQQTKQHTWLRKLSGCLALCGLACFINPYHVHIIDGVLRTMHSVITPYLADWHPLTIGSETNFTLLLLLFICCSNLRDTRIPLADRILTLAWLIYALHTKRNFMVFAVLSAPYMAYCLQEFARHAQGTAFKTIDSLTIDSTADRMRYSGIAMIVVAASFLAPIKNWLVPPEKLSDDPFGVRSMLETLKPFADKTHFLNNYNLGGYLIYLSGGKWPVFVDGRAGTAYSEAVLSDSISLLILQPGYEQLFNTYHARGMIVLNGDPVDQMIKRSSEWKPLYTGEIVSAYIRK